MACSKCAQRAAEARARREAARAAVRMNGDTTNRIRIQQQAQPQPATEQRPQQG